MKAAEFKKGLKNLSQDLKGLTLQLINTNSATPYTSLREFGNAILSEEEKGNGFSVSQAWTSTGVVKVTSLDQLASLLKTSTVSAVQFIAAYEVTDFADYLKNSFGTTN